METWLPGARQLSHLSKGSVDPSRKFLLDYILSEKQDLNFLVDRVNYLPPRHGVALVSSYM